jgi:hypothetical protein
MHDRCDEVNEALSRGQPALHVDGDACAESAECFWMKGGDDQPGYRRAAWGVFFDSNQHLHEVSHLTASPHACVLNAPSLQVPEVDFQCGIVGD